MAESVDKVSVIVTYSCYGKDAEMAKKQQALAYMRVSGRGQVDGDGFPRQQDAIERRARRDGVELVGFYRDEAVTGTMDLDHRDGLAALLDRVESNGIRLVIVERADRLARDLVVGEIILGRFRDLGVKVIESENGADLTTGDDNPTATLIRQVLGAVSEFEKAVIVLKLRAARDRKRRTGGRCEGRKPYGTYPNEKPVLDRMLAMRRAVKGQSRASFESIAKQLNADGIPTRSGGAWKPGTIYKIVRTNKPRLAAAL